MELKPLYVRINEHMEFKSLYTRINELMKSEGLQSSQDLANKTGIAHCIAYTLLSGNNHVNYSTLLRLAKGFDCIPLLLYKKKDGNLLGSIERALFPEKNAEYIAKVIHDERKKKFNSRKEFAEKFGFSADSLGNYENGRCKTVNGCKKRVVGKHIATIERLCGYLEIVPSYLENSIKPDSALNAMRKAHEMLELAVKSDNVFIWSTEQAAEMHGYLKSLTESSEKFRILYPGDPVKHGNDELKR
ncbi:MAG TPA: helix-turn-helix transcriptional regulator [Candidatus Nanoarchaeia archaeon]|nr:helix-turn-helix transcriptional regulator [Candidatus Nanoarchaeia archaeon]